MKKNLLLSLTLFIFLSCQALEDSNIENKNLVIINLAASVENASPTKKFKDLFNITKTIKLQSDEKSFIASLTKLILLEDKIIILDKKYTSAKLFDTTGRFINDIIKMGQGPGEFTKVFDMDYNKIDNSLFIYSNDDMKLSNFRLNGTLVQEKKVPFFSHYFTSISQDSLLFFVNYNSSESNKSNNLILTDADFDIVYRYFPYKRDFAVSSSGSLIKSNKNIFYNDAFDGNIYQFLNGKLSLKYKIDLGKYNVPLELTQTFSSISKHLLDYSYFQKVSAKTKDCLMFTFSHDRRSNIGIYYDNSKEIITNKNFTKNDIYHIISAPINVGGDENQFLTYISPQTLGYLKENPNFFADLESDYPELYIYLKELKDTDNPIILLFRKK